MTFSVSLNTHIHFPLKIIILLTLYTLYRGCGIKLPHLAPDVVSGFRARSTSVTLGGRPRKTNRRRRRGRRRNLRRTGRALNVQAFLICVFAGFKWRIPINPRPLSARSRASHSGAFNKFRAKRDHGTLITH